RTLPAAADVRRWSERCPGWAELVEAPGLQGLDRAAHTLAVGRVGLRAVVDVALDRRLRRAVDRTGRVGEEPLLRLRRLQPEEVPGLLEVVVVVGPEVVAVGDLARRNRRLGVLRRGGPAAVAVRRDPRGAALVAV